MNKEDIVRRIFHEELEGIVKENPRKGYEESEPVEVFKRKRAYFDLDVELLKELKMQAVIHDRNVNEIVETAIKQYLAELKK
ncbi:hypothetical protein [Bacillus smithii]|uniref:hypothetical protein n=1 Tax=Bacillus smithii TaxID=1479 RepID=UPI003D1A59AE